MRLHGLGHHAGVDRRLPLKYALIVGAIGVVYGDIGTSPLYAVNEVFFGMGHTAVTQDNVLGVISLMIWLLTLVVAFKYVFIVLRASYQGEGGVFALHELLAGLKRRTTPLVLLLLIFAAALLIGEGIITPAISVLSAVEGLKVSTTFFEPYIVWITATILTGLFAVQRKGTAKLGMFFGPIMVVWFLAIGLLGLHEIIQQPAILSALNPAYAFRFAVRIGFHHLLITLGAVTLAVTGAAALYADLGHFGIRPIQAGWFRLVYWALLLSYLGQGAYLLSGGPVIGHNIFFSLLPHLAFGPPELPLYLMVILATAATIIASQALITGAFSLASQAIALGMSPRLNIIHTNKRHEGQIYVPAVNFMLYLGCLALIFIFKSSANLAAAYGLAVSGVMLATTAAMIHIVRYRWHWSLSRTTLIFGAFLAIDVTLVTANSLKFFTGGYIPISLGIFLFVVVLTWHWGRSFVHSAYSGYLSYASPKDMAWLVALKTRLDEHHELTDRPRRLVELDRAVVFLVSTPPSSLVSRVPIILRIFMKRQGALPKRIVLLNIVQEKVPFISAKDRIEVADFGHGIFAVKAHFGFMQTPDGLAVLHALKEHHYMGPSLHRCTVEVTEEELFIAKNAHFIDKLRIRVYRLFKRISPPASHYFRFDTKPGLSKTVVPILLEHDGWRIDIPEFALEVSEERIDPDTRKPTDLRFTRYKAP